MNRAEAEKHAVKWIRDLGLVFFREPLNSYEIAGLVMAIVSLLLLVRFA
jgi:multidrug transporter EmrE-like cation transporter